MIIRGLHDTITRLSALRSRLSHSVSEPADPRLKSLREFGSNPGDLMAYEHIPGDLGSGAPLVVVLHGCTQSASSYNRGAAWTNAADQHGFALLFPEQQRANNPHLCFNWFSEADAGRGRGEALSIVQMVEALCSRHDLDFGRVYVTGLSAGGAMTAALLATYPEVFAGGAVIAGLPFGTATTVPEAFERMRGQDEFNPEQLTRLVRAASKHPGPWPVLSVWHGTGDRTVDVSNAAALVDQWRGLHALPAAPSSSEKVGEAVRRVWRDQKGAEVIEEYRIERMGHGTPLDAGPKSDGEVAGPHMLDVGISSTRSILKFWGLERSGQARPSARILAPELTAQLDQRIMEDSPLPSPASPHTGKVQEVIEKALRSAGLMR